MHLLKESYINDEAKFLVVSFEKPKTWGRPLKYNHPLRQKEKEFSSIVQRILQPKTIADSLINLGGFNVLAHLCGLPMQN